MAVDDCTLRLQAYSPHFGPVDPTRLATILQRRTPKEARAWLNSLGVGDTTTPLRIPVNEPLGLLPRVCVPVIYQTIRLGHLWLIEGDEPLDEEQLAIAQDAAEAAAFVMYRERLVTELERGREREFLRDLLAADPALRASAAAGLLNDELFVPGKVAVAVLRPLCSEQPPDEARQHVIDTALAHARRQLPLRRALHLARPNEGLFLMAVGTSAGNRDPMTVGDQLAQEFARQANAVGANWRAVVGVGEPQRTLSEASASYRQASQAARIAEVLPGMGDVVRWGALGVYRTLSQLPPEELAADALHPGLASLLADKSGHVLIYTLECFLDHAGDIKAASAELNIHRASLYYRLTKIEQLADVDLNTGGDRLALHLGLKIARLAGLYPQPNPSSGPAGRLRTAGSLRAPRATAG